MKKHIIKYLIGFTLIIIVVKLFIGEGELSLLKKISPYDFVVSLFLTALIFLVSGIRYSFLLYKQSGKKLSLADTFFFPITTNLWGFIMPFQGGLLYAAVFLKRKYAVTIKDTLSISIFVYSILMSFTGIVGIGFSVLTGKIFSFLFIISIVFALNFVELLIISKILNNIHIKSFKVLNKIKKELRDVINSFLGSLFDIRRTIILIMITAVHTALSIVWYYWAFKTFDFEIPFLVVIVYNLFVRLTTLIQLTPANIGIEELASVGLFSMLEQNPASAVLVTLFLRFSTLAIMIPFGVFDMINNFHHFSFKFFKLR